MSGGQDVDASAAELAEGDALRQMYRIAVDPDRPFDGKLQDLLELGRTVLEVEIGFLTQIEDGEQVIIEAIGDHDVLEPGARCPLAEAYCRKTIDHDEALTVQHAKVEGWEDDAAYERFGLESYIGAKVRVDGSIYGTFCFADSEPRPEPFTQEQETFVELLALWVGYELAHRQARERIEEQRDTLEAQNERLAEFPGIVSHDLRNPLEVAKIRVELAQEGAEGDHLAVIEQALNRMEALISDVLTWTREGGQVDEKELVDLGEAAAQWWETVDTEDASLDIQTSAEIEADRSRLQQLFENLFRNAIEHGGPAVTVTVGALDDGFFVEDDGPGIPEEDREQVLEVGYSTRDDGTGFGLNIVREIADAHGWDVAVGESSDGGARFEIRELDVAED